MTRNGGKGAFWKVVPTIFTKIADEATSLLSFEFMQFRWLRNRADKCSERTPHLHITRIMPEVRWLKISCWYVSTCGVLLASTVFPWRTISFLLFFFSDSDGSIPRRPTVNLNVDSLISDVTVPPVCLPATGQVIRLVPVSVVPEKARQLRREEAGEDAAYQLRPQSILGYLEVVDVGRRSVRYVPYPGRPDLAMYARWVGKPVTMAATSDDGLVTVDVVGRVRLWETGLANLKRSLEQWKSLIGEDQGPLQVGIYNIKSIPIA